MGKAGLVIFPLMVAVSTFGANILTVYVTSRLAIKIWFLMKRVQNWLLHVYSLIYPQPAVVVQNIELCSSFWKVSVCFFRSAHNICVHTYKLVSLPTLTHTYSAKQHGVCILLAGCHKYLMSPIQSFVIIYSLRNVNNICNLLYLSLDWYIHLQGKVYYWKYFVVFINNGELQWLALFCLWVQ